MNTMNETARVEKLLDENKDVQCCKKNIIGYEDLIGTEPSKYLKKWQEEKSYLPQKVNSNSILFFKDSFFLWREN